MNKKVGQGKGQSVSFQNNSNFFTPQQPQENEPQLLDDSMKLVGDAAKG